VIGGKDHWTALSFGAGLNALGAMEIIIATIGLNLGILTQDMFSIIVVMAMATSLMAPTALRWVLKRVKIGAEEEERLKKEELEAESLVAGIHRVLLPVRHRPVDQANQAIHSVEAQILQVLGSKKELSITLMTVAGNEPKGECEGYLQKLSELFNQAEIVTKVVNDQPASEAILDEAKKDYDLLVLGATERQPGNSHLFSPLVDYVVRVAPCPTLVVQAPNECPKWSPTRILVPTNGTEASRNAVDFGLSLAKSDPKREVSILNVVFRENKSHYHVRMEKEQDKMEIARQIVMELKELGEAMGVRVQGVVERGESPEEVIGDFSNKNNIDLIVLGTNIRPGSDRLYLGPRVENILEKATCPVIIFNS
jgi:nucleotide-binding universal stress UspA family protein